MAVAEFEHTCRVGGRKTLRDGKWTCFVCGEAAVFAGVRHSMSENMAMYSRRYGLKPVGPHGGLVGTLLKDITTVPCDSCGGSGHHVMCGKDVVNCRACAGTGFAPESWEAIGRVRARVIEAYPESATRFPPRRCCVARHHRRSPTVARREMGPVAAFPVNRVMGKLIPARLAGRVGVRARRVVLLALAAVLVMVFLVLVVRAGAAAM